MWCRVINRHLRGYGTNHFEKREMEVAGSARELEQRMMGLYPGRIGEFILRLSAEQGIPS